MSHNFSAMNQTRKFTVSSRNILPSLNFYRKLKQQFEMLNLGDFNDVISVFGSVKEYTPLYGGRLYDPEHCVSYKLIEKLLKKNIHFAIALSNHYFSDDSYKKTIPILEKLEMKGNSVIITNDELLKRVRQDFPLFTIQASVIKCLRSAEEINKTLDKYDYVTLLPKLNDNVELLQSLKEKERIILFASAGCTYYCEPDNCFQTVSEMIIQNSKDKGAWCNYRYDPVFKKRTVFNLEEERFRGFNLFKVVSFNKRVA